MHTHLHWKLLHPLAMCLLVLSDRTDESQWACCRHIKAIIIFEDRYMIHEIKSARWKSCLFYILLSIYGPIVRNTFELNVSSAMVANCYRFCKMKIETFHIHIR